MESSNELPFAHDLEDNTFEQLLVSLADTYRKLQYRVSAMEREISFLRGTGSQHTDSDRQVGRLSVRSKPPRGATDRGAAACAEPGPAYSSGSASETCLMFSTPGSELLADPPFEPPGAGTPGGHRRPETRPALQRSPTGSAGMPLAESSDDLQDASVADSDSKQKAGRFRVVDSNIMASLPLSDRHTFQTADISVHATGSATTSGTGRFRVVNSVSTNQDMSTFYFVRGSFQNLLVGLDPNRPRDVLLILRNVLGYIGFELICSVVVLANVVFIGVDTNFMAHSRDDLSKPSRTIHVCFGAFFCLEFLVRVRQQCRELSRKKRRNSWQWNLFDTFLVLTGALEIVVALMPGGFEYGVIAIRAIRVIRVYRALRLLRPLKFNREISKMVFGILSSVRTLFCSIAILTFVIYFFAIIFTQSATNYKNSKGATPGAKAEVEQHFGDLPTSCYSLFLAVSTGISWRFLFSTLLEVHWVNAALFLAYISVVLFGVLNVIMSVFVESAILSAQHYKDLIIQEKQVAKEISLGHMKQVFKHIDQDNSGSISINEMEFFLTDPELRKYVEALNISVDDARLFFRLLDRDKSRCVDIDEFCDGCLRLQGAAKSFDVHAMMYQVQRFLDKWSEFTMYCEEKLDQAGRSTDTQYSVRPLCVASIPPRRPNSDKVLPRDGISGRRRPVSSVARGRRPSELSGPERRDSQ